MTKILNLTFTTANNKTFRVSIRNPKEDLTLENINPVAEKIIETKVFNSEKRKLVALKKATYVSREESVIG